MGKQGLVTTTHFVKKVGDDYEVIIGIYDTRFKKGASLTGENTSARVLVDGDTWIKNRICSGMSINCNSDTCWIDEPLKIKMKRT